MDILLADKMAGDEAALKIWELHKIPVVYVAAVGNKAQSKVEMFNVPECFGYILKPYAKEELKSEIKRLLK